MTVRRTRTHRRSGGLIPLAAALSVVILGMVAFAVDTSWIVLTRSELQNAADSAALAGAGQLMNGYVQYNLPNQTLLQQTVILNSAISSAKAAAKQYAGLNKAGGVSPLTLLDADIQVGFLDGSGNFTASTSTGPYPNTVKVLLRRDAQANGQLQLFFGPVLGLSRVNVLAPSAATCYAAKIDSFSTAAGLNVGMLPVT